MGMRTLHPLARFKASPMPGSGRAKFEPVNWARYKERTFVACATVLDTATGRFRSTKLLFLGTKSFDLGRSGDRLLIRRVQAILRTKTPGSDRFGELLEPAVLEIAAHIRDQLSRNPALTAEAIEEIVVERGTRVLEALTGADEAVALLMKERMAASN